MIPQLLAVVLAAAPPTTGAKVEVLTLKEGAIYRVNVTPGGLVAMRFPVDCMKAWSPKDKVELTVHPQLPSHVIATAPPGTPLGTVVNGNIACKKGISVALTMTVVEEPQASPRVDFVLDERERSLVDQMVAHALDEASQQCEQRVREALDSRKTGLDLMVSSARAAFEEHHDWESARNGSVIVHVDKEKRLGDFGIIEFRVQNRETGPIRLASFEVSGSGSSAPPQVFNFEGQEGPAVSQADGEGGELAVGAALVPSTLLKPGVTVESTVAFPWPSDTTRFTLVVRVFAPEPRVVEVKNIDF